MKSKIIYHIFSFGLFLSLLFLGIDLVAKDRRKLQFFKSASSAETTTALVVKPIIEVTIGKQVWMAENLNVDRFQNGDPIPEAKTAEEWQRAGGYKKPAWCYYNNDPQNGEKYGKLYNWYAVIDPRGLAPINCHVPDQEEWDELKWYLYNTGGGDLAVGKKMKSVEGWKNSAEFSRGNNKSGFSALPGGYRAIHGRFESVGTLGAWWVFSDTNRYNALIRKISYYQTSLDGNVEERGNGYSVRCIKNENKEDDFREAISKISNYLAMNNSLNIKGYFTTSEAYQNFISIFASKQDRINASKMLKSKYTSPSSNQRIISGDGYQIFFSLNRGKWMIDSWDVFSSD
jgi:uncharacterized protein (TIGR02145 family)